MQMQTVPSSDRTQSCVSWQFAAQLGIAAIVQKHSLHSLLKKPSTQMQTSPSGDSTHSCISWHSTAQLGKAAIVEKHR